MALWLFKEEPDSYSFTDLVRDGSATWDGVSNALAQKHLRAVQPGDRVLFYHTGDDRAVVGVMEVASGPQPVAADPNGKQVAVVVKPVRKLRKPVTLAAIKADEIFAGWELVRAPRLSVMPVSEVMWKKIEAMSEAD